MKTSIERSSTEPPYFLRVGVSVSRNVRFFGIYRCRSAFNADLTYRGLPHLAYPPIDTRHPHKLSLGSKLSRCLSLLLTAAQGLPLVVLFLAPGHTNGHL